MYYCITRFSECQLQTMAALLMVLVSAPGVVLAGTMERAEIRRGRVRDDRFMEISHSECNELLQLYDFLLWAASQFYK